MNINSVNIHYVAIQAHDDVMDKAVWTIIGHCLYEEDARQIARIFVGGDAGVLSRVNASILDFVREHGAIIKNDIDAVDEVKELASGIDTEAFYLVHRETEKGKTRYRILMRFTDAAYAKVFCYDNAEFLGDEYFVLYGVQLKDMNAQANVKGTTAQETAEAVSGLTIDNPVFRMSVCNMLSAITNIAYDDVICILRNAETGLELVAWMTADEIMVSEYQECCVLAITVGHGEHRVIIA